MFMAASFRQVAVTRVCVSVTSNGVPVGAHSELPLSMTNGWPPELTRVVPLSHCPVTHGPLPAVGGGMPQPATTYGELSSTVACPLTDTRGFGTFGCAWPWCVQATCAPT
jgi:hypothetical protein